MMGSWWTWESLFQARGCKVSSGWVGSDMDGNVEKIGSNRIWRCNKNRNPPWTLGQHENIYIYQSWSVPFWQIRKFVDPAVFYWTSPLLYIGKNTFFPTDHITQPKKQKKTNGLATHWVPTLGGAAEVSNEFSIRPYLVQQETIRGIKFTFRPTRSRGVGISTYEVLERSHKNS